MDLSTLLLAFLALASRALAACGEPSCPPGGLYCSIPHVFEQYDNDTCTVSYVFKNDLHFVDLYAYNEQCEQVGFVSDVKVGKRFGFNSQYVLCFLLFFHVGGHSVSLPVSCQLKVALD